MAEPSSTITEAPEESNSMKSEPDNPNPINNSQTPPPPPPATEPPQPSSAAALLNPNTSTTPPPPNSLIPPPLIQPYATAVVAPPSFRPATPPLMPQFSPLPPPPPLPSPNLPQPSLSYPTPPGGGVVPPPGVNALPPQPQPVMIGAGQIPGQLFRPPHYLPMPNGYPGIPQPGSQGTFPPGMLRYPSPYPPMIRSPYAPRPGAVAMVPPLLRPPLAGFRPPLIHPIVRPVIPSVIPAEKPQTTVYVGKIASTVENDFMLSLLQLCGPVKSWKRAQVPTSGALTGFGFCEFESAEGVLRALRLLTKLNIDGQELMLNIKQATREYLLHYVEKKVETSKNLKETESESTKQDEGEASGDKKIETSKASTELPKSEESDKDGNEDTANKENADTATFGLVTDEDRQGDQEALDKLTAMLEERLKNKPLPPPPSPAAPDGSSHSNPGIPSRSKDGESDVDTTKDVAEDKDEMLSEIKNSGEQDRSETLSPDRRVDRRGKDRDRDVKRERELERYEREREQERDKREKEREYRSREDERRYKAREKEWESREKEKEHWRKREKEREKDRAQERKWEVTNQDSDDTYSKKRKHRSGDEDRRRRQREKEEDMADRLREEEEAAEDKRRAEEELKKKQLEEELKLLSGEPVNGSGSVTPDETNIGSKDKPLQQASDPYVGVDNHMGEVIMQNGVDDEPVGASVAAPDAQHNINAPAKKLGFGLLGSGKRTAVPSVFKQDEDEDMQKEKKMRPLVPIDYSTEEHQGIQSMDTETPPSNIVAAAEFARRISSATVKEEKPDAEKDRSRRSHDRYSHRDRDRNSDEPIRSRDDRKEHFDRDRIREQVVDKVKATDNKKLLDAKQLIDMIPKTIEELFSYEINWETYDKNSLHERMKPWIAKKIMEFLGEEEPTLVDYIMSSTREHVKAPEMLDRLQGILDEEAEMFVLKMWRMLIFEIKRVETGLATRTKP